MAGDIWFHLGRSESKVGQRPVTAAYSEASGKRKDIASQFLRCFVRIVRRPPKTSAWIFGQTHAQLVIAKDLKRLVVVYFCNHHRCGELPVLPDNSIRPL